MNATSLFSSFRMFSHCVRGMRMLSIVLTVLMVMITLPVFAQTSKQLVLDLENVVAQQIPYRNYQSFTQKQNMFQVSVGSRFISFYLHWQAREWLIEMQKRPDVVLHISSDRDLATTKLILQAIKDPKFTGGDLLTLVSAKGKIITLEDKISGKVDLNKIGSPAQILFISHDSSKVVDSQKNRVLDLGAAYYKFENWADALSGLNSAAAADKIHFPAAPDEWEKESYKFARLGYLFRAGGFSSDPSALLTQLNARPIRTLAVGKFYLGDKGSRDRTFWKLSQDGKTILGCETINLSSDAVIRSPGMSDCISLISPKTIWKISSDRSSVQSCEIESLGAKATLPAADCISDKSKSYWKGKTKGMCAYYTDDLIFIADKGAVGCGENHLLRHPDGSNQVVVYFRGMESKTEKEIFASPPPTSSQPYRLYAPYDVDKSIGFTVKHCQDASFENHVVKTDAQGELLDGCKPDVLYSWGPMVKILDLKKFMGDQGTWNSGFRKVFLSHSPLATFGYGDYTIRVKFKKNVRWSRTSVTNCDPNAGAVVHYLPWHPGLDYGFCSPDAVESWSYGTREHYDEVIKDYLWFKDPVHTQRGEIETYDNAGFAQLFQKNWDSHDFSESTLQRYLGLWQTLITQDKGEVFVNPDAPASERTRAAHFKTTRPIYFNER